MKRLALLLPAFFAAGASAQLALFTLDPERPAANITNIGSVPVGDTLAARLRIRNTGFGAARITNIALSGDGWALQGIPPLPVSLEAGAALDFEARFTTAAPGAYSAGFLAENISVILVASATAAPAVSVEEAGAWRLLASGMAVDYGPVERGTSSRRRFFLSNRAGESLGPWPLSVSGEGFGPLPGAVSTVTLGAGESIVLEVPCSPKISGALEGALAVGPRRFILRAAAVEPPLPEPEIAIVLAEARSARQGRLAVQFAAPSRARASGEVRLAFEPAAGLGADPAIAFASGTRLAAFTVEEGDTAVRFGSQSFVDFQTGSTAGTLVFTLDAPGFQARATVAIAPAAPVATSTSVARASPGVDLSIAGLDNTRSASRMTFTFYGRNGEVLPPGPVAADASTAFRQYFADSVVGGAFLLRAVFPVAGDAALVDSVEVEMLNSAGSSRTGRLRF